jgi:hypothetical protein
MDSKKSFLSRSPLKFSCPYCASKKITIRYRNHYHKINHSYGPFDFSLCQSCGCGFNNPMPSANQLKSFYDSYTNGMPEEYRSVMQESNESSWHSQIASDLIKLSKKHNLNSDFTWLDVGSGAGEIAERMTKLAPASFGTCIDLHPAPKGMSNSRVLWLQDDINTDFSKNVNKKFKLVYASAVLEHVLDPENFLINCLNLTESGGILYFFCPDYSSLASKVMGIKWPYYLPGEHITLPTKSSIRICLGNISKSHEIIFSVTNKRVSYSVQYMLFALKLQWLMKFFPVNFSLKFPTGALEAVILKV